MTIKNSNEGEQTLRKSRKPALLLILLVCIAAVSPVHLWSQEYRGSLQGIVTDPSGALIPNAKITIKNNATSAERSVGTSARGDYTALDLDAGFYTVTVSASGFNTLVRENVEIRAGEKFGLDFRLQIGVSTQEVVVTTEISGLITDTGSGGTVLNQNLAGNLPLTGGNIFALTQTTGGANKGGGAPTHIQERPFDNGGQENYTINGGASGGNNNAFLIDGAPNNNNEGLAFVPPQDAVSQLNVITNAYDAEFGKSGGGIISVSLKQGTNKLHGSANWDFRNNHTDAQTWQTVKGTKPQVTQWSVGTLTLNGPVIVPQVYNGRDKTFISTSYQHFFDKIPNVTNRTVPSASQAVGNFCSSAPGNMGIGTVIYDPLSGSNGIPGSPTSRTAFGGCPTGDTGSNLLIAAPSRIDPIIQAVEAHQPAPNFLNSAGVPCTNPRAAGCGINYVVPSGRGDHYYAFTIRADHNISNSEKFFGSYEEGIRVEYINNPNDLNSVASPFYPSQTTFRKNHAATLNLTSILTPTMTATSKLNWLRHNGLGRTATQGASAASLGFSPAFTGLFGSDNYPGFAFSNYPVQNFLLNIGTQGGTNNTTYSDTWTASEAINKVFGANSFKVGGGLTVLLQNNANVSLVPTPNYSVGFTQLNYQKADSSGDAIASALLGYPSSLSYTNPLPLSFKDTYSFVFVQDDWRVSKNLTINLGLRWDNQTPPHERYNRGVVGFNSGAPSVTGGSNTVTGAFNGAGGSYIGGLVYATPDQRSPYNSSYKNFQPRFGFAYQVNAKLVVRGGWGRSFDNAGAYTFLPTTGFTNVTAAATSTDGSGATALLCSQVPGCTPPASNPLAGISANGFASALPNGLIPATGSSIGAKTGAGGSITFLDPTFRPSYVNQFNFGFEYQLPFRMVAHLEYNGSRAHGLPVNKSINQITASQFLAGTANTTVSNPFQNQLPGTTLNGATTTLGQLLKPFPQYTDVVENSQPIGRLWYNALQAKLDKRLSHGLDAYANFTWSKNLGATSYLNPNYDLPTNLTRQLVNQDIPFAANVGMTWKLPIFTSDQHKFLRATLGGWSISGDAAFHKGVLMGMPSGTSGVIWTGVNPGRKNASFAGRSFTSAFNNCVVNSAGTAVINGPGSAGSSLNAGCQSTSVATAAWRQTTNSFYLSNIPPFFSTARYAATPYANATVFKAFQITERVRFELRILGENITNTPYFNSLSSSTPTATSFAQIAPAEANDPRSLQFTARVSF